MEKRKVIKILGDVFLVLSVIFVLFYRVTLLGKLGFMRNFGFLPGAVVGCALLIVLLLRVVLFRD